MCPQNSIIALIFSLFLSICSTPIFADQSTDTANSFTRQEAALLQQLLEQQQHSNQALLQAEHDKLQVQLDHLNTRIDDNVSHVSDISLAIALFAILITVILFALSIFGYFSITTKAKEQAKEATKVWIGDNTKELRIEIDTLQEEAKEAIAKVKNKAALAIATMKLHEEQVAQKVEEAKRQIQSSITKHDGSRIGAKEEQQLLDAKGKEALQIASEQIISTKEKTKYRFDDWNTLAFAAWSNKEKQGAADYWQNASDAQDASEQQKAQALFNKGIALGTLNKVEEAISSYEQVIEQFSESQELALQELVAKALINKGITLGTLNKVEEAISSYEQVIEQFSESQELALQEQVASALFNKGIALGTLNKVEEEISSYEQVIEQFFRKPRAGAARMGSKCFIQQRCCLRNTQQSRRGNQQLRASYRAIFRKPRAGAARMGSKCFIQQRCCLRNTQQSRRGNQQLRASYRAIFRKPRAGAARAGSKSFSQQRFCFRKTQQSKRSNQQLRASYRAIF